MPLITKRKINPPVTPVPQSSVSVPQLTVETTAPASQASTHTQVGTSSPCYECEYDIPLFYNPFAPLFHFLWVALLIILGIICAIVLIQLVFFSLMGLIMIIVPKYQKCKKCGKIFKYSRKNSDRCPYCGALIEEEIKPH